MTDLAQAFARVASSLLLLLVAAPLAIGQTDDEPPPDSELVHIEVEVADRRGDPVAELAAGDFEATIDGRPVQVVRMTPHGAPLPAEVGDSRPATAERRGLSLLIYVDSTNSDVKRRGEVLERLRASLRDRLGARDRAMVVTTRGEATSVEQEFTADAFLIDQALERVAKTPIPGRTDAEFDDIVKQIERTLEPAQNRYDPESEIDSQGVAKSLRSYAQQQHRQTTLTCDRLRRAVDTLTALPGRRAIVYVGSGLSLNPGEELLTALRSSRAPIREEGPLEGPDSSLPVDLSQGTADAVLGLAKHASLENVALHTLDIGDQRGPMTTGAADTGAADFGSTQPGENITLPAINFGRRSDLEASLRLLTGETGGRMVRRHQDIDASMAGLMRAHEGRYTLAFALPDGAPGSPHSIDIATTRKRLEVHHRKSFRNPNPDDHVVELLRTALMGGQVGNPLEAWIDSQDAGPLEGDSYNVNLSLRVPIENLALQPLSQSHRAQLTVFMAASDGNLWTSPIRKVVLPISIPNEEMLSAMGQSIDYAVDMRIFRGREQVALAVRDDLDPEMSVLTLTAPGPGDGAPPGR